MLGTSLNHIFNESNNRMLTVSIVLYHHSVTEVRQVIDCVLSEPVKRIYLIDNSLDDHLRELEVISERIRYIHSVNRGYGAGHNIAIREAIGIGSNYHIVINPDVYFEKGTLEMLIAYMNVRPEVGLVMPRVLYPDGRLQYLCKLLPKPSDLLLRRFFPWKNFIKGQKWKYEMRFMDYNQEMEVPSLSGCFMFMRISVLKKTGGFDERFFMYVEDLDLCRRIGQISRTMYYPDASIYHAYAKGSYHNRKLLGYHIFSVLKYFNKWGWIWDTDRKNKNKRVLDNIK